MNVKKFSARFLLVIIAIFFYNFSVVSAEEKIVEGDGEYIIDKNLNETFAAATEHAREEARRTAAEKAEVFVESSTEVINMRVTKDKIRVVTAQIMKILVDETKPVPTEDGGVKIVCHIKAVVDTSKINLEEILGSELQYNKLEEQNKKIQQLEEENRKLKEQAKKADSASQIQKIQDEFDKNQKQFLISKYERDLDLYDFDNAVNWQEMLPTAEKLNELDPLNPVAFRATIYAYREQGDLKKSVDYCNRILNLNCPDDTAIEAYTQLGDIYYNEIQDNATAKKFIDKGIALCKKNYSATMIEKFVNGTDFQISMMQPVGKTNTIRELYILKCNLENIFPTFKNRSVVEDVILIEYRIYDIKYRTNW